MIKGIGIDIIELSRVKDLLERQPKFIDRILTNKEKKEFESYDGYRKIEYFAGRFAAKEAYSKALGTGIGKELRFVDMEVIKDEKGKPSISVNKSETGITHLSISHSRDYAVAQVIIEHV